MNIPVFSSLRARLVLLVLVGALPLLALLIYSGYEHRNHAFEAFQHDKDNLVMRAVNEQRRLVAESHQLLTVLAEAPQVSSVDTGVCSDFMRRLLTDTGSYSNIGVIDIHGEIRCSGKKMAGQVNVSDRSYFQRALQSRDFSIGDYQVGRISNKAVLVFSFPVIDEKGRIVAVLFAALPMSWVEHYVTESPLPPGGNINVIDYTTHTLLAQYPMSSAQIGSSMPAGGIITAVSSAISAGRNIVEITDPDGVRRMHFFRILRDLPGGKEIFISLAIPSVSVYARANDVMYRNLMVLFMTVGVLLLLAWYGSYAMVLRQLKDLLAVTHRMAAGDLTARVVSAHGSNETAELGREFNRMAAALEHRDANLKQVEAQLRTNEQSLRRVFDTVPDIIYTATASNNFGLTFISSAVTRILGFTPDDFITDHDRRLEIIHPDDREQVSLQMHATIESDRISYTSVYRMRHKNDNKYCWFEDRVHITRDAFGQATILFGVMTDVTERRQAEMLSARMGRILETSWNELYVFDATTLHFIEASLGALQNSGYSLNELKLLTPLDLKPSLGENDLAALLAPLRRGEQQLVSFEIEQCRKNGSFYPVEVRLQLSHAETPPVFIAYAQDISERKSYIAELEHKALYDNLTNLPSRSLFLDHLRFAISVGKNAAVPLAVFSIGVVRLREVNDILGHSAGDIVLHEVAARLRDVLDKSDTVARLGGGEFAIVQSVANVDKATVTANKILQLFELPMTIGDISLEVEAAIGIALYPTHGIEPDNLLQYADIAMHIAKNEARGYSFYKEENVPYSLRKLKLSGELRKAIERKELTLFYQPKIDIGTGRVIGVEALARWPHPIEGMVSPGDFIPMIEQSGLIRPFTMWVLEEAITQLKSWSNAGIALTVAVNLSTRNLLDSELLGNVMHLLKLHEVSPEYLTLEVTESAVMSRPEAALKVLKQLHKAGLKLSIDDYGTGYSSLAYLKKLPVDELKIDQTFIFGIASDEDNAVIVRSTIELAQNMGLKVVAEGVEDQETIDILRSLNCDIVQGFYMSRPVPVEQLEQWLNDSPWGLR